MQISFQNNNINFSARTKYPMIPKQEIVKCLNMGYSQAKIGMKYGIPPHAVSRMVQSYRLNLSEEDLKKYLK